MGFKKEYCANNVLSFPLEHYYFPFLWEESGKSICEPCDALLFYLVVSLQYCNNIFHEFFNINLQCFLKPHLIFISHFKSTYVINLSFKIKTTI